MIKKELPKSTVVAPALIKKADMASAFKPFESIIFDTRALLRILDDLALIERSLFRAKEGFISQKARDFTTSSTLLLFDEIEKMGAEPTGDKNQLNFLHDLIEYLKRLPQVKVTLAFSPTNNFIEKISTQISNLLGKKAILDVLVDEYIVGGAVFEFEGRISRQTLDIQLESVLKKFVN